MRGIYTVEAEGVAVTAAVDLVELTPADDKIVEILGWLFGQSSDVGDAAEEILRYRWIRGHTTGGSGGAAPTPRPVSRSDAAAGFAAETNNTTAASVGTTHNLVSDQFNIRAPAPIWLPEGCELDASQADTTILARLMAAPADSLTMAQTTWVRERG